MYVYLKFGENWTTHMGDNGKMSISPILFFLFLLFMFFSLNPSVQKTVRGAGLKFCTQVGSDDCRIMDPERSLRARLAHYSILAWS